MKLRTRLEREKKDICTLHDPTGRIPKKLKEKKKKRTNYQKVAGYMINTKHTYFSIFQ